MESFDAFDFGNAPLYGDLPNTSDFSKDLTSGAKSRSSPLDIPYSENWDQLNDQYLSGSFGLQNLFDDDFIMHQQTKWDASTSPKTDSVDSLASSPAQRTISTTELSGWEPSEDKSATKRTRQNVRDGKSACWTSPLCPAFKKEGSPPDPSTCDGGCASNLFDDHAIEDAFNEVTPAKIPDSISQAPPTGTKRPQRKTKDRGIIMAIEKDKPRTSKRLSSEDSITDPGSPQGATKPSRRQPHNEIEKKYRESINTHLQLLKRSIPAFRLRAAGDKDADIEDLASTTKPSKGAILAGAVAHIRKLDREKKQLEQERAMLRQQVKNLQALVKCEDCSLMQYVVPLNLGNQANHACPTA